MKMKNGLLSLRLAPMTAGFALATTLPFIVGSASAFELNLGEVKGSLDTTVSYGTGWRMEDATDLSSTMPLTYRNKDDGTSHFDNDSKPFTSVFKITSDLELKWENYGMLVRGSAFYDEVIMDRGTNGGTPYASAAECNAQNSADPANCGFAKKIEDFNGNRARILDAYVYGNFDVAGHDLNVRLGEQVINWGEALFIQGGINSANPASLSNLRLPGAEIKEALLPLPTASFSVGLSRNVTLEGFAQFDWDFSEPDSAGTYYSTDDAFAGYGSERVIVEMAGTAAQQAAVAYNAAKYGNASTVLTHTRLSDAPTKGTGQYGVAIRLQPEGSDAEYAFYHMNYHSHTPVAQGIAGEANAYQNASMSGHAAAVAAADTLVQGLSGGMCPSAAAAASGACGPTLQGAAPSIIGGVNAVNYIDTAKYQLVYQEDVKMYGVSFSTTAGDLSFSGELAYRPEYWVLKELGDNLVVYNFVNASTVGNGGVGNYGPLLGTVVAGQVFADWASVESYNLDLVAINNFGNALGTDGLMGVLEVGAVHYAGYDSSEHFASTKSLLNVLGGAVKEGELGDYMSETAWGYRAVLSATYNDVFAGTTLNPSIRFAHDMQGNSDRAGAFMEGRKAATVAVNAVYQNALDVGVAYNTFWGAGVANLLEDRDSVTLTVKYSF